STSGIVFTGNLLKLDLDRRSRARVARANLVDDRRDLVVLMLRVIGERDVFERPQPIAAERDAPPIRRDGAVVIAGNVGLIPLVCDPRRRPRIPEQWNGGQRDQERYAGKRDTSPCRRWNQPAGGDAAKEQSCHVRGVTGPHYPEPRRDEAAEQPDPEEGLGA